MKPEVSVIMSEYNTEYELLERSIKSILKQTYSNFEFIIMNDGSSNQLDTLVKKLNDTRIKIITNEKNIGLARSLNRAIEFSEGDFLVRMDTDDVAHPNRIDIQLKFIKNNSQYSVVGTSVNLLTDGEKKIPKILKGEIDKDTYLKRIYPTHPSVIMRKSDIIDVGMYPDLKRGQDVALWGELLIADKKIYVIPEILLDYRVYLEDYNKRKLKTRLKLIRRLISYYKRLGASPLQYHHIFKFIVAGVLPNKLMSYYHKNIA